MAGRNHLPPVPNSLKLRQVPIDTLPHPLTILEDRIAIQHRDIQILLLDNQQLAATHLALNEDLALAQDELRHLSAAAADVKAERDDQVREVYERSLKLEAEVRSIDALRGQLIQVRTDVEKLSAHRQDLTTELRAINGDLAKARTEAQQVTAIKADIQAMQKEIQRGRAAIEYEKKLHASNIEHEQRMEQNMIAVACEIEKIHAELANVEKRARAEAAVATAANANPSPEYAGSYSYPEVNYGGNLCIDPYAIHQSPDGGITDSGQMAHQPALDHAFLRDHRIQVQPFTLHSSTVTRTERTKF